MEDKIDVAIAAKQINGGRASKYNRKPKPSKIGRLGSREVIGWKIEPKSWYPEIGLFDTASMAAAKAKAREEKEAAGKT